MIETFFDRSFAIDRLRQGPLAGHIDLLAISAVLPSLLHESSASGFVCVEATYGFISITAR